MTKEQDRLTGDYRKLWRQFGTGEGVDKALRRHLEISQTLNASYQRGLKRLHRPEPRVLEVACGTGINSYVLAESSDAQVTALDLVPEAVAFAASLGDRFGRPVHFLVADGARLPFPDATFDFVFSGGLLEHFTDPTPFIREQLRVLRPSGILGIDVPQKYSPYTLTKHFQMRRGTWPYGWEREYSCRDLVRLGRGFGLRPIDRVGHGYDFKRDWGLGLARYLAHRLCEKNPINVLQPVLFIGEKLTDLAWYLPERYLGHLFLMSLSVLFERERT